MTSTLSTRAAVQRRTIATLLSTQVLGGLGVGAAISVNAMLAKDVSGVESLAGLAQTAAVLGTALVTLLIARVMDDHGRRIGLTLGYALGFIGTALSIVAGVTRVFPLLLVGAVFLGVTTAANNQSRYAATDLSLPAHRGGPLARGVGHDGGLGPGPQPVRAGQGRRRGRRAAPTDGAYLFSGVGMLAAMAVMFFRLRPDPLVLARAEHLKELRRDGAHGPGLRTSSAAGEPTAASRGDRHEPEPRGHGLGHGDDLDPHGSRPRLVGDHRPGHQHPHPRDVRLLARRRHGR